MKKIGFVLAPNSRVAGSLVLNREIFKFLNNSDLNIQSIVPHTDKFYKIPLVGSLLNYFSLYGQEENFDYIIGTSFANLPFIESSAKLIQLFHSTDTGSYRRVMKNIESQNSEENRLTQKWIKKFSSLLTEKVSEILPRLQIAEVTEKICAQKAEKIIVVSESVKEEVVKYFGVNPEKIKVILNGIAEFWFKENRKTDNPEVFFTSRANSTEYLFLEKGLDRAFEIFENVEIAKNVIFHFGTSNEIFVDGFKSVLSELDELKVFKNLNREKIKDIYKPGSFFLQTSRTEACQLTLIEAMASKMVPVTFPVGIAPSVIKNGYNGFLVNSVEEAISVINELKNNKAKMLEIGENAHFSAKENFSSKRMIKSYYSELMEIVKQ